jgi:hypothetical protein
MGGYPLALTHFDEVGCLGEQSDERLRSCSKKIVISLGQKKADSKQLKFFEFKKSRKIPNTYITSDPLALNLL